MKAVVFHGAGDIRLEKVSDPKLEKSSDAIIRLTASAICGTDLHFVRGTVPGVEPGTILGHEGVGVVEELGKEVRNFKVGDRVVIPSTIACGYCSYCRAGYHAQCDNANPNGSLAGTAFYGGPKQTGPFQGLQAERARIPLANVGMVKLPDEVSDDQAILISDIFPTGYFGADIAEIDPGDNVSVFGCGPVGLFAIKSAMHLGASRVIAIDTVPDRLAMARDLGAEPVNFNEEDPVATILGLTGKIGVDRAIDAVGVDAYQAEHGAGKADRVSRKQYERELEEIGAEPDKHWLPGDAPSQVLRWAVAALAKAGTLSIIGVYPPTMMSFPIGMAMNKNLTINMGNCNHRKYIPGLVELVRDGTIDPLEILTKREPMTSVIDAYKMFAEHQSGWVKVELKPAV
jgi:threonine dehydrogenase-like Zn-dependent dehydrogenase